MDLAILGAAATGLLFGFSLIVAVGPQNTFVLRQGLRRRHVGAVVAVCTASDLVLIAAGTGGAGALLDGRRWLVVAIGVVGVGFLLGYAALALRRAWRPGTLAAPAGDTRETLRGAVLACLAFTWLNPGVYVDTVVVLGPVSHSHAGRAWWFAAGAMLASAAWFAALGLGSRAMAPLFTRPRAWRVLDTAVAIVMTATAVRLASSLLWT